MSMTGTVTTSTAPHTIRWTFTAYSPSEVTGYRVSTSDGKSGSSSSNVVFTSGHSAGTTITGNGEVNTTIIGWTSDGSASVTTPSAGGGGGTDPGTSSAFTSATPTSPTQFQWFIGGLSNAFNTSFYIKAAVFNAPFTNGQASQPSGLISSTNAGSGSSNSTPTITVNGATSAGGHYDIYGGVQAANGNWYTCSSTSFDSPSPSTPPGTPPSITATATAGRHINVSWGASSGSVDHYEIWAGSSDSSGGYTNSWKGDFTGTSGTITIDKEYYVYDIQVYAANSAGLSSPATKTLRSLDETPPVISATITPSASSISVTWSGGSDPLPSAGLASGFFDVQVYCSGPGGGSTTFINGFLDPSGTMSFSVDGNGNTIQKSTFYTVQVIAHDNQNNPTTITQTIKTLDKPIPFAWSTAKTSGANFSLSATEWTNLLVKVNEYRRYKLLSDYAWSSNSFIAVGGTFLASQYNEVRTAIAAMSPPTPLPGTASPGGLVFASMLNGLRDSLNSIP